MNIFSQTMELLRLGLMFPVYCLAYMLCPSSSRGVFMKNPFVKFVAHSASYMCFLLLLAAASQRVERITLAFIGEQFNVRKHTYCSHIWICILLLLLLGAFSTGPRI